MECHDSELEGKLNFHNEGVQHCSITNAFCVIANGIVTENDSTSLWDFKVALCERPQVTGLYQTSKRCNLSIL